MTKNKEKQFLITKIGKIFNNFFTSIKKPFVLGILLIIALSIFLRFFDYLDRWGLAYDQARDILVAKHAIDIKEVPLIGPFASAGQFVYGPQWYWILMVMVLVSPGLLIGPWLILTLLHVGVVGLMIAIGYYIGGRRLAILCGFLTAISPGQIAQSTNLISPSMVGIFSALALFFLVRYLKKENRLDLFLLGLSIATAINIHFQAVGLLIALVLAIIFTKNKLKNSPVLFLGFVIPFIPLFIFELKTNFFETRHMAEYYFNDQFKVSYEILGRRWLTYIGTFWPQVWSRIIGGYSTIFYVLASVLFPFSFYALYKKRMPKIIIITCLVLIFNIIQLRYFRGPLFDGYIIYLHFFIIIFTAWGLNEMLSFKRLKVISVAIIILLFLGSALIIALDLRVASNKTYATAIKWRNHLVKKYPDQKFAVYDYKYKSSMRSLALVMLLAEDNLLDDNGKKIGVSIEEDFLKATYKSIHNDEGYDIFDLKTVTHDQIVRKVWTSVNPSEVYRENQKWFSAE